MRIVKLTLITCSVCLALQTVVSAQDLPEQKNFYKVIKNCPQQLPLTYVHLHYLKGLHSPNIDFYTSLQIWPTDTLSFLPIWEDLQLNRRSYPLEQSVENPEVGGSGYGIMDQLPLNKHANFISCLSMSWNGPNLSTGFLNIGEDNKLIDRLVVSIGGSTHSGIAVFSNFSISIDTVITVTTIRSIEQGSTPMYPDHKQRPFSGQRTDISYKVSAEGRFVEVDKIVYYPKKYRVSMLSNPNKDIRKGNEKVLK